jgi:predicted  nucleic acid-binding Zn-ribbon protein
MEPDQLRELSTNASLNHWPPHLGVVSEADKIQYLADRLREAADMAVTNDELLDEVKELREKIGDMESDFDSKIQDLKDDLDEVETKIEGEE